jgi:uncharacterized membrane protein YecN with MAPEG domain
VLTPDSGQLRSLPADEAFILPRSGFVQQIIQPDILKLEHGNAAEYIPLAIVMILILALLSAPPLLLHGLGSGFTFGRVAQALGMTRVKHPNAIRFTGNLFTGLVYLIGSVACLYYGLR